MANINLARLILVGLMLVALPACATGPVFHSFEFGGIFDPNKDIEILDWRYGHSKLAYLQADKGYLAAGHIPQGENTSGLLPVGDSLYVKWRVQSTGKVYEDTVDLRSRLPSDMDHKRIHFSIKGPQLIVYVISEQGHPGAPDCPVALYKDYGCARIYPDHWLNF